MEICLTAKDFSGNYGKFLKFGGKLLEIYPEFTGPRHKPSRNRAAQKNDYQQIDGKGADDHPAGGQAASGLKEGDLLGFAIEGERVILCKPLIRNLDQRSPVLAEWESEADQRSYYGL